MDKKIIPEGMYCYSFTGKMITKYLPEHEAHGMLKSEPCWFPELKPCPYYTKQDGTGFCSFLSTEIDDQIKECQINEESN